MAQSIDVRVPDIGDFKDVPVIEVLVKPGEKINRDDSLITLESEKASMEVPSPVQGTVREIKVKAGDKVSQGSVILTVEEETADRQAPAQTASVPPTTTSPTASSAPAPSPQSAPSTDSATRTSLAELRVPDIGDFKGVPVIDVLVTAGQQVTPNDSVITLESEKASMEVPAGQAGIIRELRVNVGDKVSQGDVIGLIEAASAPARESAATAIQPAAPSRPASASSATLSRSPQPASAPPAAATPPSANGAIHASPSIRRFARELGVDLHRIEPTGPNGRVTRADVQNFVKRAVREGSSEAPRAGGAGLNIAPLPVIDFAQFGEIERKPLSRIKRLSGPNLHRNWVTIPHVTQDDDADVTDLEEFRRTLNAELSKSGVKVTMLAFLMKAAVAALKAFPEFNSSLDGEELVLKKYYHIGFAADTPGGLLVPVVRDADKKGLTELARETWDLAAAAREGKLTAPQMQGGTFTISSLGSIGGTYFTPIINAPEVAILGACRAAMRPVWNGTAFVPRLMQPLSLSYDHRVIDGAAAARFITYLGGVLSDLRRALL
ncbi:MAG TPA: dihydrolipoyllysine-residue acetyltransferase [Candidatus Baltobacteraceae bacterium]|jgi:pyruvate dehydrogenase E2 component (dihydrolipoamide acetyltransferase)|nr:dihydrolipoyllysine-residue acetyltransferase [Candidatus Baltobacteraceae bacterium]